ncbi:MAG TPA: type II toxin-antitoxin system VapC family toxin [Kofleriaceae bacterium]|nr:type II toxin-antitoxin system VapC family toxin [Kofleriaceae bacterium]
MRRLLDTNAYVAWKRGDRSVMDIVNGSSELAFSTIVIGELLYGFRHGNRFSKNANELDELLADARVSVLPVTTTTADRFGRIAAVLRKAGTPIPTNDIWIAAHAFESGAELVSFDAHFESVPGLVWTQLG